MITGDAYEGVMHFLLKLAVEPNKATGKLTGTENMSSTLWKHGTTYNTTVIQIQINHNSISPFSSLFKNN